VLVFEASTTFAQDTVRVRGTIERVEGQTYVVKSRDGAELKVVLADNALVVAIVKASISDIKPGSFVGVTGMPQADGSQKAIEVHIFPEAMRGTGEGHYPWDLQPKSTMTNASVVNIEQTVTEVDGRVLSMKYKDGEKKIIVPPNSSQGCRFSSTLPKSCLTGRYKRRASTSAGTGLHRRCNRISTSTSAFGRLVMTAQQLCWLSRGDGMKVLVPRLALSGHRVENP